VAICWGVTSDRNRVVALTRAGAAGLICLALAGCWWTQPGAGPQNSRWNRFESKITADNVTDLTETWTVSVPGVVPEPVTSGNKLFLSHNIPSNRQILALDVASGAEAWHADLPAAVATDPTGVAYSSDTLLASHIARFPFGDPQCNDIVRLDPETGALVGAAVPNNYVTTAFVTSGDIVAYIDSTRCAFAQQGRLVVRDRASMALQWTAQLSTSEVFEEPIIADGRIYAAGAVFDAAGCGAATCTGTPASAKPLMATGGRYFSFDNLHIEQPPPNPVLIDIGSVRVFSATDGAELWRDNYGSDGGPNGAVGGIAATGDTLFVAGWKEGDAAPGGRLAAYPIGGCGAAVCDPTWTAPGPRSGGLPAVAGDVVYTLAPTELTAYDANGCGAATCGALKTITLPSSPYPRTFIVSAGHVFVLTTNELGTANVNTTITSYAV
jgi:hypothetical protein